MPITDLRIGIAMSGGGIRAAVFHFGMLARLAEDGLLENLTYVSTVSGGSLGMALILAQNDNAFPTSCDYLKDTVPKLKTLLTTVDLAHAYKLKVLRTLLLGRRRTATDFAGEIEKTWRIHATLADLPDRPIWIINAACFETGKNWRFRRKRVGDYSFNYTRDLDVSVSEAVAASSAVPVLVGPLVLDTQGVAWFKYDDNGNEVPTAPRHKQVHLFDGAMYDNLGVEALIKRKDYELNFLIVSNGSSKIGDSKYRWHYKRYCRLLEIIYRRSVDMYSRFFVDHYLKCLKRGGRYFQIGNSAEYIFRDFDGASLTQHSSGFMSEGDIRQAEGINITRMKLSPKEFDLLLLHGYEVANCTLHRHAPTEFDLKTEYPSI